MTIRKFWQNLSGQETPDIPQTADRESLLPESTTNAPKSKDEKAYASEETGDSEAVRRDPPLSYTDAIRHSVRHRPSLFLVFPVAALVLWMFLPLFWVDMRIPSVRLAHHSTEFSIWPSILTASQQNNPPQLPPQTGPSEIRQRETSHSIKGTFPLRDLLELESMSGSIAVTIEPQPGYGSGTVRISTMSGSIKVNFLESANRTFHTTIRSMSGCVTAELQHVESGSTSISTQSGSLRVHYHPSSSATANNVPSISTQTISGSTKVDVDNSSHCKYAKVFAGSFRSMSGSIRLNMPRTWEGRLHAKSVGSGSINVHGSGLTSEWQGRHEVDASRGSDKDLPVIDIISEGSGSIHFTC